MIFDSECHTAGKAGQATHAAKVHREPLFVPKVFDAREMEGFPPGTEPTDDSACLVDWMDRFEVDRAVIQRGLFRQSNARIVEAIRRVPDRLDGFATYGLHPPDRTSPRQTQAALDELDRGIQGGCRGVGEIPLFDFGVPADQVYLEMRPLLEYCAEKSLPVFFHTGNDSYTHFVDWIYPEREDRQPDTPPYRVRTAHNNLRNPAVVEDMALEFPTVPMIIAHMGKKDFTFFEAALMVARRFPKVYLTTSNTVPDFLVRAVREIGPERILFGTDWKRTNPETPFDDPHSQHKLQLALVEEAPITDAAKELILGQNLERLLAEVRG